MKPYQLCTYCGQSVRWVTDTKTRRPVCVEFWSCGTVTKIRKPKHVLHDCRTTREVKRDVS